jgi:hypothetical protein
MVQQGSVEHAGLLRAWHLAILRFAVTHENADRLGVLAIATEMDRLGRQHQVGEGFSYFRKASAQLFTAMVQRRQGDDVVLSCYLAQIDDPRLRGALAAALDVCQPQDPARNRLRPTQNLWRGLASRSITQP